MRFLSSLLILIAFTSSANGQSNNSLLYEESNFVQTKQGADPATSNELFAIWYRNAQDTNLTLKKLYVDSTYSQLVTKSYYRETVLSGPYYGYTNGDLTYKANYKYGKLDGEVLTYKEGYLARKAFYTDGIKTGTWEEFDQQGKLVRKVTYNERGYVVSEDIVY